MSIFWGLEHYSPPQSGTAVTIGVFDGLHLGHQTLLRKLVELGKQKELTTAAITFDRHPLEVIAPDKAPLMLNSSRERAERLATFGVNRVLVLRFDETLAAVEPDDFVRDILIDRIGMRAAVVGQNFHYGRGQRGDALKLVEEAREFGFEVEVVPPVIFECQTLSSTLVRKTIEEGAVRKAASMLGMCYTVRGQVVHGDGRGQQIGFPTANIKPPDRQLLPANGVYAVKGRFNGMHIRGAANLGVRPTLGGGPRCLEVHLIGYSGDLYGQEIEIQFLERLRDERAFASISDLVEQIKEDVNRALCVSDCRQCNCIPAELSGISAK